MSTIIGWNFAARRKNDEDGKKYHTDIQCWASEDERNWIPLECLRLSPVGFYRYIGPLRLSEGVSLFCMCRWARKCVYPCGFATPKSCVVWDQGAGFLSDAGNNRLPKSDERGSGRPFITGLNCCQLRLNSCPVSSIVTSSLEPSLVNPIKR
jgi:hypothetical protein